MPKCAVLPGEIRVDVGENALVRYAQVLPVECEVSRSSVGCGCGSLVD